MFSMHFTLPDKTCRRACFLLVRSVVGCSCERSCLRILVFFQKIVYTLRREERMKIVNFSHPMTDEQKNEMALLLQVDPGTLEEHSVFVQVDQSVPRLEEEVWKIISTLPEIDWKQTVFLLPGLSIVAVLLMQLLRETIAKDEIVFIARMNRDAGSFSGGFHVVEIIPFRF